jgi:2-phosphoglycerate kinase
VTHPRRIMPLPLGGDQGLPYSRGLMARTLMAAGVAPHAAYAIAQRLGDDLVDRGRETVDLDRLETIAVEMLGDDKGREAAQRLRRYQQLRELELPIMILIGGATGTGKSTVASEVAYRFGITRVTSTDFIRETMRAFFSRGFMPSVHYSSFEAGDAYPDAEAPLEFGFLQQARNVLVGVHASMERAVKEGWSMVLEGVHLVPGLLRPAVGKAVVVSCVLTIEDEHEHALHFFQREDGSERPMSKYLAHFEEIRAIQELLVQRAEREGVPVIENDDAYSAASAVADLVLDAAERIGEHV